MIAQGWRNARSPPVDILRPCDFDFFRSSRGGLLT